MAFKLVLLVAVCLAQGFVLSAPRTQDECRNPEVMIPYEFSEAVNRMGEVKEAVTDAAVDAYGRGEDIRIVIACFRAQRQNFIALGKRVNEMVRNASMEIAEKLGQKAEKYEKIMGVYLRNIAVTMRQLPETVYNYIKDKEFAKAAEAVREARRIVNENARALGKAVRDMAAEVPEIADRTEELARNIYEESKKGSQAIENAIKQCIKEGGPREVLPAEEEQN